MKKYLIGAFFMSIGICSFSQEHDLSSLYSNEQYMALSENNPEVIQYWNTYLEKGWALDVVKESQELSKTITVSQNTLSKLSEKLNPLDHKIYPAQGTQYIGIEDSDLVIIVYPKSHVIYQYNKARTK